MSSYCDLNLPFLVNESEFFQLNQTLTDEEVDVLCKEDDDVMMEEA